MKGKRFAKIFYKLFCYHTQRRQPEQKEYHTVMPCGKSNWMPILPNDTWNSGHNLEACYWF